MSAKRLHFLSVLNLSPPLTNPSGTDWDAMRPMGENMDVFLHPAYSPTGVLQLLGDHAPSTTTTLRTSGCGSGAVEIEFIILIAISRILSSPRFQFS
jgi:hypothetical protein